MVSALRTVQANPPFSKNTHSYKQEQKAEEANSFKKLNTKQTINSFINGASSVVSLFTFLSGNFNFLPLFQEKLESFSETVTKIAFSIVHLIGTIDLWQKKNFFPFLGYAMAAPIAMLSSGYNLWVATGLSGGLINFAVITDQREVVDDKGEPIPDKEGNTQVIGGDFKGRGWRNSIETTVKESQKMLRELYEKPVRILKFSHSIFLASSSLIISPLIGLLGFKNLEAGVRNIASIASETALLFHKNITNKCNSSKTTILKSPIAQSGLLWICTAISDLLKRFDYFSDKVNNLTHLSLFFDRLASLRFTKGILDIKGENKKVIN